MELASGKRAMQDLRGIYRKGIWAFVENLRGERDIMTQAEYDGSGILPAYTDLQTEEEFHESVLAHRSGEPL